MAHFDFLLSARKINILTHCKFVSKRYNRAASDIRSVRSHTGRWSDGDSEQSGQLTSVDVPDRMARTMRRSDEMVQRLTISRWLRWTGITLVGLVIAVLLVASLMDAPLRGYIERNATSKLEGY